MKKIILLITPLLAVLFSATSFTSAYFSDNQSINQNSVTTGIWNPGRLTITEVFYDPAGADAGSEWIRLRNTGGYRMNLENYILHFDGAGSNHYVFPNITLASGKEVVVHLRVSGTNTNSNLYWQNTGGANMDNASGSVSLFNQMPKNAINIIDFVQYGTDNQNQEANAATAGIWAAGTFVADADEGFSLKLINNRDNNLATDWRHRLIPTT